MFTPASFAAGCVAGAAGQLIGHPLDTVKVYAQTQGRASALPLRVLFRGLTGPVVTAGGVQSVRLGLYETFRRCWSPAEASTPLHVVGLASAAAGFVVSFMMCPMHRVKVTQQLHGGGLFSVTWQLVREGSLFRGLPTVLLFESNGGYMRVPAPHGPGSMVLARPDACLRRAAGWRTCPSSDGWAVQRTS